MRSKLSAARIRSWLSAILAGLLLGPPFALSEAQETRTPLQVVRAGYLRQLEELAQQYAERGQQQLADQVRESRVQQVKGKQLFYLPPFLRQSDPPLTEQLRDREARHQLQVIRRAHATRLWQIAEGLAAAKPAAVGQAYRLAHEAVFFDPDQQQAKHLVAAGYSPVVVYRPQPGTSRHKEYGWAAGAYWRVKTDHFLITTNHSRDAGVEAAQVLEELHNVWRQLFAPLWLTEQSLRRAIDGAQLPRRRRHHKVVIFADREEYVERLKRAEPQVALSTGMYRDVEATSFFYMDHPVRTDTWRHELTHQLFQEVLHAEPGVGLESGFWAVEAIALYMESAARGPGYYQLGGIDARRLQYARYRALNEQFYLPMSELVRLGKENIQQHPDIRKLYSQSAGMAHFLMDGQRGEYRDAFVQRLGDLYRGGNRARTLADLMDIPLSRLDYGYHAYLKVSDKDLASLRDQANSPDGLATSLVLAHTSVTDAGLLFLAGRRLDWLDLTACRVTDEGVAQLSAELELRRLSLEQTDITDRSCQLLAKFAQLEELDLSHTAITDEGLAALGALVNLRSLWLADTQITDQGLLTLDRLKSLEHLNVDRTQVTPAGWEALEKALPRLGRLAEETRR